jgi:hypothetical protein
MQGVLGCIAQMSKDVFSACFLGTGHAVSGGPNGCITVW